MQAIDFLKARFRFLLVSLDFVGRFCSLCLRRSRSRLTSLDLWLNWWQVYAGLRSVHQEKEASASMEIAQCKGIQGFWISRRGFRIPGTWFQSLSEELGFQSLIRIAWAVFLIPGFQIPQAGISRIPNPDSLTWGEWSLTWGEWKGYRCGTDIFNFFFSFFSSVF